MMLRAVAKIGAGFIGIVMLTVTIFQKAVHGLDPSTYDVLIILVNAIVSMSPDDREAKDE